MIPLNEANEGVQEPTVLANPPSPRPSATPARCMALVRGTGTHLTDEIHAVLRRRLRIACTISAAGFSIFVVRNLWSSAQLPGGPDSFDRAIQGAVLAILVFLCAILWTSLALSHRTLRVIELVLFGSMAFYFADLQFRVFYPGRFHEWAKEEALERVIRLGNSANNLRWFFLIVLYGMFIPNTWRRCAIVVGCIALIPLSLTVGICPSCAVMGPFVGPILFDSAVLLSMASAMAIFGSYRINVLQQEAHQFRKLGQYHLLRKLGYGGMGEVYLGEHVLLRRSCAIKLIRPDQAGDPITLSRFEREVQAMATLTHWNTVEIYDYGRTADGTFYYVMEYLPGLSLQELVDLHGPLPPGRAIHFLRQICAALDEAHAIGLIHRDIKPSNIITCRRGSVHDVAKLLDFGLVQELDHALTGPSKLTIQGAILGSPNYFSPEQAAGKAEIDARSDIYSLGALAYFLVTGQPPFVRDTVMELIAAHMKDEVLPPRQLRPEIPTDLEEVILTCLRKNPDDRYADAACVDRALAACEAATQWDTERAQDWWRQDARTLALEVKV